MTAAASTCQSGRGVEELGLHLAAAAGVVDGLGGYPSVSLAAARKRAAEARTAVSEERDPIAERQRQAEPTFGEAAEQLVAALEPTWKHWRSAWEWRNLFRRHCGKIAGLRSARSTPRPCSVCSNLSGRLRRTGRSDCETTSSAHWASRRPGAGAKARTRLRGAATSITLPRRPKTARRHHAAMPYTEVGAFLARLSSMEALTARVVEFVP